jgi:hypothetical protein
MHDFGKRELMMRYHWLLCLKVRLIRLTSAKQKGTLGSKSVVVGLVSSSFPDMFLKIADM